MNISAIKTSKEYEALVPRMNKDDDKVFDESVKRAGEIRDPVVINQDDLLLDGHSRITKAKKYGITKVPYRIKKFTDKLLEKKYVIECNLERRHLTVFQKIQLGYPLIEIEKKLAAARQKVGKKLDNDTLGSEDPKVVLDILNDTGKVNDIVAKKIGVSGTTMMRGKKLLEEAPPEILKKLDNGTLAVTSAYNHITRKERNLPKVELPKGEWSVVLCDFPIKFNDEGVRGSASNNYETMTVSDLKLGIIAGKDIRELFAEDCVFFGWFSASTIFYAKDILASWGFECKTNIIWDKDRIGTGSWLANKHEHLVIAVKGDMPLPAERLPSIIQENPENRTHSSKPARFYQVVEIMYPKRKYLDLFSRYKHSDTWTCFGNELKESKEDVC